MRKIKEVIVVEGKDDTTKVKQAVDADTIESNGSAINQEIIERIRHAKEKRGVIIFTDPDAPGERIRTIISDAVPGCKHAFLPKDQARSKFDQGIGIEHASLKAIQEALATVYELTETENNEITKADLLAYGLLGGHHASRRRDKLGERLRIGKTNGKQLLKRLNMFHISQQEFEQTMEMLIQEENDE
ncbi:ribonuclease M5 [Thalassobacillus devorans]|uniref:Ribonuclease M5 n=1 Tax=Thalassobacillus devorans TaxID=279813 RepID=A0ABQ1PV36_9BACI|nr:ribonuclease M5 [Thalassobacillus devorans]NIK30790.1 ribonuclease M5 [Thalassobacillus devorans]GGD04263.1 ribonuclease M5 [Thalassobacillus devorans]